MIVKSWEQIPFAIGVNNLLEDKVASDLPFSVSCGTQQGLAHFENSMGNQDAISIITESDVIIGVICDGCSSSDVNSVNDFTSNQVGANLLSKKTCSVIRKHIKSSGVKSIKENLSEIQNSLLIYLRGLTNELREDETDQQLLINNFFTTTIIAVAIDKEAYCIFNLGDGIVYSNANRKELNFLPGVYLTSYLENKRLSECGFNIIEEGKPEDINSVFISSDGFSSEKLLGSKQFHDFLNRKNELQEKGFMDGLPEFRKLFLTPYIKEKEVFDQWPDDDASFILIRKLHVSEIEQQIDTPKHDISPEKNPESFSEDLIKQIDEKDFGKIPMENKDISAPQTQISSTVKGLDEAKKLLSHKKKETNPYRKLSKREIKKISKKNKRKGK